jgi:hypothetical protein
MIQNKNILHYNLTSFKQKLDIYFSRQANAILGYLQRTTYTGDQT